MKCLGMVGIVFCEFISESRQMHIMLLKASQCASRDGVVSKGLLFSSSGVNSSTGRALNPKRRKEDRGLGAG